MILTWKERRRILDAARKINGSGDTELAMNIARWVVRQECENPKKKWWRSWL